MSDRPEAKAIVGLLADADRRRVLAAVELGADSFDRVTAATGLPEHRCVKALGKLVDGRIVVLVDGLYFVQGEAFAHAAREALRRPRSTEHEDEPADLRRVLDAFVRDGRVAAIPAAPNKRRIVLAWLARRFEPGVRYPEVDVTAMLEGHAEDAVTLRRYLIDESFLDRSHGEYWRCGGTVDVAPPDRRPAE